ncbi:hypothetical protein QYF36_011195 [Acer negundo]|nr:hypothetical protein QYF36_011195 [Acer negundo]
MKHGRSSPDEKEINRDILKQQAAAYVEAIRFRMIAQGIPFEAVGIIGDIGPIKFAIEIPPRRVQPPARPMGEKKNPQPDSEGSARSRKSPRSRHQKAKWKEVVVDLETSDEEGSVA